MKKEKIPSKIYLQIGADLDDNNSFPKYGVTWDKEKINANDLEYILIDEYNELKKHLK